MEGGKEQFSFLKPFCIILMKEKTVSAVTGLQHVVESMDGLVPPLMEYVLLPLRLTLQQSLKSDTHLMEATLKCMAVVFQRSEVSTQQTFQELLTLLCTMLDEDTPSLNSRLTEFTGAGLKSEEALECVLLAIQQLHLHTKKSIVLSLHGNLAAVGHMISVLLPIIEHHDSRNCKIVALHTLASLSYADSSNWKQLVVDCNADICNQLGTGLGSNTFASFLPGICITLCTVATGGLHIGQVVTSLTLLIWTHYTCLVMRNECWENKSDTTVHKKKKTLVVCQDEEWWASTDKKLERIVSRYVALVNHENWQVRQTLVYCASTLLQNCYKSLSETIGPLLEIVVTLTLDDYSIVAKIAHMTKVNFTTILQSTSSLTNILEERLFNLSSSLPRHVRGENEKNKLIVLKLLRGYLELLELHVYQLTCSPSHITRLLQALVQTIQLETVGSYLLEQREKRLFIEINRDMSFLPLSFLYLREESMITTVQQICFLLGQHGSTVVLLDILVQQVIGTCLNRSEYLLLLHWVLLGVKHNDSSLSGVINGLVEFWSDQENANVDTKVLVYEHCFMLHIIGDIARKLGANFSIHLQYILATVMEMISSNNVIVSQTAIHIAQMIAQSTGYQSVAGLITGCADYLVNDVVHYLMYPTTLAQGCHILHAIISHGTYNVLPLLNDCRETLLLSLDQWIGITECWEVCLALAKRLTEWVAMETPKWDKFSVAMRDDDNVGIVITGDDNEDKTKDMKRENVDIGEISQFFLDYHEKNDILSSQEVDPHTDDADTMTETLPVAVQSSIDILQRCGHHLSTPDHNVRLCVLECVHLCLCSLEKRQKELLPEVHNIWSPFLHRLTDNHLPVRMKAIEVLLTMGTVSQEFLRRRVIEQTWSKLLSTLEELHPSSQQMRPTYHHSMEYKLLVKVFSTIAELCIKINVGTNESEQIARSCVLYLSKTVDDSLQRHCVDTLRTLAEHDPDTIWLLLVQLCPHLLQSPHHASLNTIVIPECTTAEVYKDNVTKLFSNLY